MWDNLPVVLNASNPVDVLNYDLYSRIGGDRRKFIGFSHNDTLRFKWSIAMETGMDPSQIEAFVLGEHGAYQVPVFSSVKLVGENKPLRFSAEAMNAIQNRVDSWFGKMADLKASRTMGWTSAIGIGRMLKAIRSGGQEILPCSVIPDGEYGLRKISIGLPVILGPSGVEKIIEIPLEKNEEERFSASVNKIKKQIEEYC